MKKAPRKNRKKKVAGCGRVTGMVPALKVMGGMAALLMVSVCFVYGYGLFVRTDCLRISDVQVKGVSFLSPETVIHRAGIEAGMNILAVNLSVARRRLQADPWIAEVRISRVLPSTIVINIREHTPLAIVDWGDCFLINSRRAIFKRVESTDPASLPVISGVDYGDLDAAGRSVSPVLNAALDVIEMGSIIEQRIPGMNIRKVIADRDTGLTLYAFETIDEVRLGFDDDNDNYINKFRRLGHMLEHCSGQAGGSRLAAAGFEYPDRVVVKTVAGDAYAVTNKGGSHEGTGHHRRS
jgi:cell division protein FtsQ